MAFDFMKALQDIYASKKNYSDHQYQIEHNADGTRKKVAVNGTQGTNIPTFDNEVSAYRDYNSSDYTPAEKYALGVYHNNAQKAVDDLYDNGYEQIASKIQGMTLGEANDYIRGAVTKTSGRTKARDYITTQIKDKYGMTDDEINNALQYNENTGELSLGGRVIDKGDSTEFGNAVWYKDTSPLQSAVDNYISDTGRSMDLRKQLGIQSETLGKEIDNSTAEAYKNPFTSDIGKTIMNDYGLYGSMAAQNASNSVRASNGGTIDSYSAQAAANARNSQIAAGHTAALEAWNQRMQNILGNEDKRQTLIDSLANSSNSTRETDMSQQLTDQNIKESNSNIENDLSTSTGYTTYNQMMSSNPYVTKNSDGTFSVNNAENTDYMQLYNDADSKLKSDYEAYANATSTADKLRLASEIRTDIMNRNYAASARNLKTGSNELGYTAMPNAESFNTMLTNWTDAGINADQLNGELDQISAKYAGEIAVDDAQTANNIKEASVKSTTTSGGVKGNKKTDTGDSVSAIDEIMSEVNSDLKSNGIPEIKGSDGKYTVPAGYEEKVVKAMYNSSLSDDEIWYALHNLFEFGNNINIDNVIDNMSKDPHYTKD